MRQLDPTFFTFLCSYKGASYNVVKLVKNVLSFVQITYTVSCHSCTQVAYSLSWDLYLLQKENMFNDSIFLRHMMVASFLCYLLVCTMGLQMFHVSSPKKKINERIKKKELSSCCISPEPCGNKEAGVMGGGWKSSGSRQETDEAVGEGTMGQQGRGAERSQTWWEEEKPGRRNCFVCGREQRGRGNDAGSGAAGSEAVGCCSSPLSTRTHGGENQNTQRNWLACANTLLSLCLWQLPLFFLSSLFAWHFGQK